MQTTCEPLITGPVALALAVAGQAQADARRGIDLSAMGFLSAAGCNAEAEPVRPLYRKPTRRPWPRTQAAALKQQAA